MLLSKQPWDSRNMRIISGNCRSEGRRTGISTRSKKLCLFQRNQENRSKLISAHENNFKNTSLYRPRCIEAPSQ